MNFEEIKEMWEMTEGGEMPKDFRSMCESYHRHLCVFRERDLDERDFAILVMNYKLYKNLSPKKPKEKSE